MISGRYLLKRTGITLFIIWAVMTFLFLLFEAMPGDMASTMAIAGASEAYLAQFEEQWGLDQPIYIRYIEFFTNYLTLDFGLSMRHNVPITELIGLRIFNSVVLILPALITAYLLGSFLGTLMGANRDSWLEKYGMIPIILSGSVPGFFIGMMLVIFFASWMGWFPTGGMLSPGMTTAYQDEAWYRVYLTTDFLHHLVLPFATIVLRYLYVPMLLMRTSVVEVSGQDFSYYHRITGKSYQRQLRHIAKHASLPVVTNFPLSLTSAIGGLVLVEMVFTWPGIGWELIQAVFHRDLPVVQFVFILVAIVIIIGNFVVDIIYTLIDPRVEIE